VVKKNPIQCREKRSTIRQAHDLQPVGSLRPDSGLHPVGVDNPFYALDFRQSSLIQNPQAGCLASTFDKKMKLILEGINSILWIVVILHPLLIPMHSSMSRIQSTLGIRSMVFIYGTLACLFISKKISALNEKEYARRELAIHYYPIWIIPAFFLVEKIMIATIWSLS